MTGIRRCAEGLSELQIQEKFLKDGVLSAFGSAPDVNAIVYQIRNEGLSFEDGLKLATLATFGKITNDASKGKVTNWSVSNTVTSKFPTSWGDGFPNKKGVGLRWQDPDNKGNGVRIDKRRSKCKSIDSTSRSCNC